MCYQRRELGLPRVSRSVGLCVNDYSLIISAAAPLSLARTLYVLTALSTASGVPYALTFLRCTNGTLSIRADKLAGSGGRVIALTYAFNEKRSYRPRENVEHQGAGVAVEMAQ